MTQLLLYQINYPPFWTWRVWRLDRAPVQPFSCFAGIFLCFTLRFLMFPSLRFQRNRNTFLHVSDRFPFQESRISAIVNVCLCCGNAKFRTGNLLFRSFYWRKREDTVRQPDLFFCVSVCFRYCVNTTKKFHICRNQVFQWEFFFILT